MVKIISIPIEGIEYVLLKVIWQVVLTAAKTGRLIDADELNSPVRSADVFAIIDEMAMGVGDEVDKKLMHLRV